MQVKRQESWNHHGMSLYTLRTRDNAPINWKGEPMLRSPAKAEEEALFCSLSSSAKFCEMYDLDLVSEFQDTLTLNASGYVYFGSAKRFREFCEKHSLYGTMEK